MYRMDHYYERHQYMRHVKLSRLPSEFFREHIYVTFQDDWAAFQTAHLQNAERLMWANDFPHSDSTWPRSQEVLRKHASNLPQSTRDLILHDNVSRLYGL
jgi:predicted TIM-barrel fold metal-dependent hydrolase